MGRVKKYHQYNFEDVYGEQWQYHAINPFLEKKQAPEVDGQMELEDLYDPSILGAETEEEFIRRKMSPLRGWRICNRTIMSGDLVEVDMYPVPPSRKDIPRASKNKESRQAQKNLNNKNRVKEITRLACANFSKRDYILTLSYTDGFLPTEDRARKDIKNFISRVKRRRKKQGLPPLKYIYVIEYAPEGKQTKKVRIHHHMLISGGMDRDELEALWGKGRCQARHVQPDDFELTGFAKYISKLAGDEGKHSYACSKNLDKPKVFKSVTKLSRRRFADIIRAGDARAELIESLYRGQFKYLDSTAYINQEYGGFYLYSRLRRKVSVWGEDGKKAMDRNNKTTPAKENTVAGGHLKCKAFLEYDWAGNLADGEATCSILLEAMYDGKPITREYYKKISHTTKNRAELKMAIAALSKLKPCSVEIHTTSAYLTAGIQGRFKKQQEAGYQDIKNADLIEEFLKAAEPFHLTAAKEKKNEYTEAMRIQRELRKSKMLVERDRHGK